MIYNLIKVGKLTVIPKIIAILFVLLFLLSVVEIIAHFADLNFDPIYIIIIIIILLFIVLILIGIYFFDSKSNRDDDDVEKPEISL